MGMVHIKKKGMRLYVLMSVKSEVSPNTYVGTVDGTLISRLTVCGYSSIHIQAKAQCSVLLHERFGEFSDLGHLCNVFIATAYVLL